ncbi:MAG: AAA family ATPase [Proteobacteria bacterium]|nr:AAA family ATPase [Pseudomonadota bacterium]MBU1641448.1 AAA family ATPase [Pseudomonadota bacterium]
MYKEHFGFTVAPFSIAPDPHILYMSERHKEALAHLFYGMRVDGGFVMLTGEVGTGKTTICRCLLEQVPENTDIAFIFNPKLTVEELLSTICDEFGIHHQENQHSIKFYVDHINSFLLHSHANGRKAVLIIDEAQNLSTDVLEQIRLLTNLETNTQKLLQIILLGQPELAKMLQQPELRQLAQRITARYHLTPLSEKEVGSYVAHRLARAGGRNRIFPESTIKTLFKLSNGTPRLINIICDRSLLGTYVQDQDTVTIATIKKAAREVFGERVDLPPHEIKKSGLLITGLLLLLSGSVMAAAYLNQIPAALFMQNPVEHVEQETLTSSPQGMENPLPQLVQHQSTDYNEAMDENITTTAINSASLAVSALEWPEGEPLAASLVRAYQALFDSWGIADVPVDIASAYVIAEAHNLGYLNQQGSFGSLLALNRPAVLSLYDENDKRFYAAFISYQDQTAELVIGSKRKRVSIDDFKKSWNGEYSLLWEKPAGYSTAIAPENQAANVDWLDKKLAIIQERPASLKTPVLYDNALVSQVKQFQFDRDLVPDGIVGPQTIIHLNSAYSSNVPKLMPMDRGN